MMVGPKQPIVDVRELVMEFATRGAPVRALDNVDFSAWPDECVGLVGESGSGKSTLAMALGGLSRAGITPKQGGVTTFGRDVFHLEGADRRRLLSEDVGFVFQNPIGSLDPTRRIGKQFFSSDSRPLRRESKERLLRSVGLDDTDRVLASYPHELSGGMAQRVGIAIAIAPSPLLLIADEPTAALDASVRTQILDLLTKLRKRSRATLILVSHDLRAVRAYCDRICVMYGGRIIESGPTREVLDAPRHPYTAALLRAIPGPEGRDGRIEAIPGSPPAIHARPEFCTFAPRCPSVMDVCTESRPESVTSAKRSRVCWLTTANCGDVGNRLARGRHV